MIFRIGVGYVPARWGNYPHSAGRRHRPDPGWDLSQEFPGKFATRNRVINSREKEIPYFTTQRLVLENILKPPVSTIITSQEKEIMLIGYVRPIVPWISQLQASRSANLNTWKNIILTYWLSGLSPAKVPRRSILGRLFDGCLAVEATPHHEAQGIGSRFSG